MSSKKYTLNAEPGEYRVEGSPIDASVERVLNDVRLALFGLLLTIGLTVGFGVPGGWLVGVIAGVGAAVAVAAALRWRRSQRWLAELMHRVLGR